MHEWCVFSVHTVHYQYRGTGHVHSDVMWLAHYQRVLPARQCLWLQRLCKSRSEHRRPWTPASCPSSLVASGLHGDRHTSIHWPSLALHTMNTALWRQDSQGNQGQEETDRVQTIKATRYCRMYLECFVTTSNVSNGHTSIMLVLSQPWHKTMPQPTNPPP